MLKNVCDKNRNRQFPESIGSGMPNQERRIVQLETSQAATHRRVDEYRDDIKAGFAKLEADIREVRTWLVSAVIIIVAAIIGTGIFFN